ncbi:hypothetical protein CQ393_01980 [Stenotrophomonas sp. MYb238]|uniref:hypothetical protein n=1 Tax=Stenotrophomonas sp. MYb238 TaxID=2040281 RepID=UPI001290CD68|nr:hypothetical protein [Stenotrophomonas sp. MYb238]MQP74660.1 hypothetical protein [Stenotrophomonas sp. MYb238]
MKGIQLYLLGPGQERRPVRHISTELADIKSMGIPIRSGPAAANTLVEIKTLADDAGNVARQIDCEGFRYKFTGSEIPWSLVFG